MFFKILGIVTAPILFDQLGRTREIGLGLGQVRIAAQRFLPGVRHFLGEVLGG